MSKESDDLEKNSASKNTNRKRISIKLWKIVLAVLVIIGVIVGICVIL